jgi:hypothetical protein
VRVFVAITASDPAAVQQHLRILREAGILPPARTLLTDRVVMLLLVGMLAGLAHGSAPEATRRALTLRLATFGGPDLPPGYRVGDSLERVLTGIVAQRRRVRPHVPSPVLLRLSADGSEAGLVVSVSGRPDEVWMFYPADAAETPAPTGVWPVDVLRVLSGPVISALAMMTDPRISELPIGAQRELLAAVPHRPEMP